jgi:hypothetical protein
MIITIAAAESTVGYKSERELDEDGEQFVNLLSLNCIELDVDIRKFPKAVTQKPTPNPSLRVHCALNARR